MLGDAEVDCRELETDDGPVPCIAPPLEVDLGTEVCCWLTVLDWLVMLEGVTDGIAEWLGEFGPTEVELDCFAPELDCFDGVALDDAVDEFTALVADALLETGEVWPEVVTGRLEGAADCG